MAKNTEERRREAQFRGLAKSPDGRRPGNHMSDVTLSNESFYSQVNADRNVKPIESIDGDFAKCRQNLKPHYKGKTQL